MADKKRRFDREENIEDIGTAPRQREQPKEKQGTTPEPPSKKSPEIYCPPELHQRTDGYRAR